MKECLLILCTAAVMLAARPAMKQLDDFVELCLRHREETEARKDGEEE